MRLGLLGPFEVRSGEGTVVAVPGTRLRALLAALAVDPGRVVSRERLVDWVWGDQPPADEANAVQALVSRLRRLLGDLIEAGSGGYRLAVGRDAVDVSRFEDLVAEARTADVAVRAERLRSALGLWRGAALADVGLRGSDALDATVTRLEELRLAALGDRVDVDLQLGRGPELVSELTELVATYPLREGFVAALMRALAETGRGSEALALYQRTRERLADELGADPSSELSALHTALLRGELGERAASRRTNLRAGLTSFVGREEDLAAITALVTDHRLVTLTGAGGSGKTRLATETARTLLADLPDGAWLVELAPARTGGELAQFTLAAIGLRDQALLGGPTGGDSTDRLLAALRERAMLLILDNCEHMVEASAAFADRLLGECPRLRILATSREPLGITGEVLWQVEPLALPASDAAPSEVGAAAAVRLLLDRAGAVRKDVGPDAGTVQALARICRALDGMPLAIELAAARLRTMSVEQLARRLDDRFRLLTGGSRTALPRHRTLRAVVDWSWDLLSDAERLVLRRLSVFSGGASLEAAERVCADEALAGEQVLDLLASLLDKSLLVADGDEAPRYRMLDTIREYATDRLVEAGDAEVARQAHLAYFTELAETADPHLRRADQLTWLAKLEAEHDNVGAALRRAIAAGQAHEAMRMVGVAGWYWFLSGHKVEATELSVAAVSLPGDVPDEVRAMAYLIATVFVTAGYGNVEHAQGWIEEAYQLARSGRYRHPILAMIGPLAQLMHDPADFVSAFDPLLVDDDPWVRALARATRGRWRRTLLGADSEADDDVELALAEFRTLGERMGTSLALSYLADQVATRGQFARACDLYDEAIAALTELGAVEDTVRLRARQAQLHWLLDDERSSAAAMAEAQRWADRTRWPDALADLTFVKARLAYWRAEPDRAREQLAALRAMGGEVLDGDLVRAGADELEGYLTGDLEESRALRSAAFQVAAKSSYRPLLADTVVGVADLAVRLGRDEQAARLLGASEALRGGPDRSSPDAVRIEAEVRSRLGEEEFAEATRVGAQEDWRALVELTLAS